MIFDCNSSKAAGTSEEKEEGGFSPPVYSKQSDGYTLGLFISLFKTKASTCWKNPSKRNVLLTQELDANTHTRQHTHANSPIRDATCVNFARKNDSILTNQELGTKRYYVRLISLLPSPPSPHLLHSSLGEPSQVAPHLRRNILQPDHVSGTFLQGAREPGSSGTGAMKQSICVEAHQSTRTYSRTRCAHAQCTVCDFYGCIPINLMQTPIRHNLSPFPLVILFLFLWIWRAVVSTNGLRN
jgi:hypothetical protein